jgi:CheY-like chemotaxis protein
LPLCRRLAGLLGGRVWVESEVGHGATFFLLVPRMHESALEEESGDVRPRLLIVDERADRRAALGEAFRDSAFLPVEASTAEVTEARLASLQPTAALVDIGSAAPAVVEALRAAAVPLVSVPRAHDARREQLVAETYRAVLRTKLRSVLVIDDDEAYRTILGRHLASFCERVRATANQRDGMAAARAGEIDCLVLDIIMPETDGLTLLQRLRDDPATEHLPVIVCSSKALSAEEQALVRRLRAPFLPKEGLAPAQLARALFDARRMAAVFTRDVAGSAA